MIEALHEKWIRKLVEKGLLTKDQAEHAQHEAKTRPNQMIEILLKRNYVSERDLTVFLSQELGIPVMNPLNYKIPPETLELIPLELVKRYQVIPISRLGRYLTVATSNPFGLTDWDDLASVTGFKIKPVLATASLIDQAIKKFYARDPGEDLEATEESIAEMVEDMAASANYQRAPQSETLDLSQAAAEAPVIKIANVVIREAVKRRASDLFIEPWEKHMRVRCRVDGLLEEVKSLPLSVSQPLVSRIKVMSHMDIAEHRMPQDGRFKARIENREVDFRVSVIPTSFGEKICIRLLDLKSQSPALDQLGFSTEEMKRITEAASKPHGMILVTGPTGSGKTTTLYSILSYLHTPDKNITTVEDPVEYQMLGINQVHVREYVGLTFAAALRSILRQDPNVIMIGEIRDLETMDIAIKAALTGHLVLSTLHTNDAASSVVRMVNMGIEPFLIASSVHMVTAQRLVRRLCQNCKEPLEPTDEILKTLKRPSAKGVTLCCARGCGSCRNTGFQGRRVITEVLSLSPKTKELILKRSNGDELKQAARKEGMTTLRESGLAKVIAGETTLEEVLRITASDLELESC